MRSVARGIRVGGFGTTVSPLRTFVFADDGAERRENHVRTTCSVLASTWACKVQVALRFLG